MTYQQTACRAAAVIATGNAGIARHYRVQLRDAENDWQLYRRFLRRDQAEQCVGTLVKRGERARLVECNRTPVAL